MAKVTHSTVPGVLIKLKAYMKFLNLFLATLLISSQSFGLNVYSQLKSAQAENKASDYAAGTKGRFWFNTSSGVFKWDDGSAVRQACTTDNTQTLTNKTLSGNIATNLVSGAATVTLPTSTSTLATLALSETLTSKTISALTNVITNIANAEIKSGAAIARNKIAAGTADYVVINDGSGNLSQEQQLLESRGGTGTSSYTVGDMLYASGTVNLHKMGIGSSGQVLKVVTGVPAWSASTSVAPTKQILTTTGTGTYTTPANVTYIRVTCIGAGGGGGGAAGTAGGQSSVGAGGGGGGVAIKVISPPSATYSFTVSNAGGTAGASGSGTGGVGTNTTFSTLTANGGGAGSGAFATNGPAWSSGVGAAGGTATGGDINFSGGIGSAGQVLSATQGGLGQGGGSLYGVTPGAPVYTASTTGAAGGSYGIGGSGGANINNGGGGTAGVGGPGLIIVEEYY